MSASSSKEQLQECFICHTVITGDVDVFEHHLNQCLDASQEATPGSDLGVEQDKKIDDDDHVPPPRAAVEVLIVSDSEAEDDKDDDDDVCPICDQPWRSIDLAPVQASRDAHVGECLEHRALSSEASETEEGEEDEEDGLAVTNAKTSSSARRKGFGAFKQPRLLDGTDTEPEGIPGLVAVIASIVKMAPRKLSPVWTTLVANEHTHYIRGRGTDLVWSCGYRNAQMLFSSLRHLPEYNTSASGPSPVPSILELQGVIEDAWKAGHDLNGAAYFNGRLRGSKRWTGATEMYTALTALSIRSSWRSTFVLHHSCQIVDFPKLPHAKKGADSSLIRWIVAYFTGTLEACCVSVSNSNGDIRLRASSSFPTSILPIMSAKQPLYLQHQGHSRTVVGIEYGEQGEGYLLMFDPARRVPNALKKSASKVDNAMSTLSTSPSSSKKRPLSSSAPPTPSVNAFWAESPQARLRPDPDDARPFHEPKLFTKMMANSTMMSLPSAGLNLKSLGTFRVDFKSLSRKDQYQVRPLFLSEKFSLRDVEAEGFWFFLIQVLYVEPGSRLSAAEVEERKIVKSKRVIG
ncbi:BZ3500_MvSof-1268-A1-R1_Chr8-2g10289 [Microbotryum saponariae]|uniref:BZ3500_MvSof-1268-A1-R1_Chr8-2g10289 protein n=1 Tax=Microbotryum saponariae TaxID=289078 RepID=A0A2X0MQE5_9BASI|nr:BZ3500_MvSof-1268-A1-R1_Chr8-2g10289 [Microbotryum saponariae]SDA02109.1 BZ3501_MvSof-1269-A2-R1_Chr8-2g10039 [Microbotryum saponariae]